jgi:hypothetical protein
MSKKFLIGQLACYGDCLYATSIAKQIKFDYPEAHVTWAVSRKYSSILLNNPDVDYIWVLDVDGNDFYGKGWDDFQKLALDRKRDGVFDEVIFSQIAPLNWSLYTQTIRLSILSTYSKRYSVSLAPVVRLTSTEIENVRSFAIRNNLSTFKNIVLFECAPGSGQSKVDVNFALDVAKKVVEDDSSTCFIMTSNNAIGNIHPRIIDGSELTYRENAELTKYCTLLVGCSSGITWLATSDWAKPLPMLQLLNRNSQYFAGVEFDLKQSQLNYSEVIELLDFDRFKVSSCLKAMLRQPTGIVKEEYHEVYRPGIIQCETIFGKMLENGNSLRNLLDYRNDFNRACIVNGNPTAYPLHLVFIRYFSFHLLRFVRKSKAFLKVK